MTQRRMHFVGMVNPPTSQYAENWRNPLGRSDWLRATSMLTLVVPSSAGCST